MSDGEFGARYVTHSCPSILTASPLAYGESPNRKTCSLTPSRFWIFACTSECGMMRGMFGRRVLCVSQNPVVRSRTKNKRKRRDDAERGEGSISSVRKTPVYVNAKRQAGQETCSCRLQCTCLGPKFKTALQQGGRIPRGLAPPKQGVRILNHLHFLDRIHKVQFRRGRAICSVTRRRDLHQYQ